MESIKVCSHVDADGMLTVQMPPNLQGKDVEVIIVVQPLEFDKKLACKPEYCEKNPKISEIVERFRRLRREIPSDGSSIREMIEEGRRF